MPFDRTIVSTVTRPFLALALTTSLVAVMPSLPVKASATAFAAAHAPAPARERRGQIRVDTAALGDSAEATRTKILDRIDAVLTRGGVTRTDDASDPVLRVTVEPLEGDTVGYRISYRVDIDGAAVKGSDSFADCRLCTEDELADATEAAIERTVEYMEVEVESDTPLEPDTDTTDPTTASGGEGDGLPPDVRSRRGLGGKGWAGVALLGVGGAGLIAGIVLAVPEPKHVDTRPTELRTTRPAGFVAIGVGGAMAITGAVLLALDRRDAKRQATAADRKRAVVRAIPWVAEGAGLGVVGRF